MFEKVPFLTVWGICIKFSKCIRNTTGLMFTLKKRIQPYLVHFLICHHNPSLILFEIWHLTPFRTRWKRSASKQNKFVAALLNPYFLTSIFMIQYNSATCHIPVILTENITPFSWKHQSKTLSTSLHHNYHILS